MKALLKLKKQMEIDFLKTKTYEEINDIFNQLKEKLDLAESELKKLRVTDVSVSVCELDALKDGYCENYRCKADCIGCDFYKQTVH